MHPSLNCQMIIYNVTFRACKHAYEREGKEEARMRERERNRRRGKMCTITSKPTKPSTKFHVVISSLILIPLLSLYVILCLSMLSLCYHNCCCHAGISVFLTSVFSYATFSRRSLTGK